MYRVPQLKLLNKELTCTITRINYHKTVNPYIPDTASSIRSRRLLTPLVPSKVSAPDKAALEELQLVNELDEEEKNILLKLIETFVSKKKI